MFKIEYRYNGQWNPIYIKFKSKRDAKAWAESSDTCRGNGYQIIKCK